MNQFHHYEQPVTQRVVRQGKAKKIGGVLYNKSDAFLDREKRDDSLLNRNMNNQNSCDCLIKIGFRAAN